MTKQERRQNTKRKIEDAAEREAAGREFVYVVVFDDAGEHCWLGIVCEDGHRTTIATPPSFKHAHAACIELNDEIDEAVRDRVIAKVGIASLH
jgi:hypothetical protein